MSQLTLLRGCTVFSSFCENRPRKQSVSTAISSFLSLSENIRRSQNLERVLVDAIRFQGPHDLCANLIHPGGFKHTPAAP